ncbi:SGNH/GDSL hydrolase family protein [Pengzhenrongella frigida]|uniref:SGNH/GDSL hydrolase family protein n=1 Tax=Pengzhenrongella frigida TaxID=1259133 RepID=UPI001F5CE649|nr:SGNH/GDSL hydrolase family protein [Cellulomonas sp. HLT2-17]
MTDLSTPAPTWTRYVAIGDSFTEGLWDVNPDDDARCRGWADILAVRLSSRRTAAGVDPLEYANLAIRGRLLGPILTDQLPTALALEPNLVSLVGGGNDILRPTIDVDHLADRLEAAVVELRASGADVLLSTGMNPVDSALMRRTRHRVGIFNSYVWSIARRHDAQVLDLWGMQSLRDWRMWSEDRIHLTTEGHARVAQAALVGLGLEPDDAAWDDPLTPLPPVPRLEKAMSDAVWLREHVYPWATRRLRHRSSGDLRTPKRPELGPVEGPFAGPTPVDGGSRATGSAG